ncbi:hypothetical protein JHK87_022377 [Glycine soja]|nr:hypothetical protein JHK87_022377 [Glycine soja]
MACHIMNQSHTCMVKCHEKLRKIPLMQEWTVDLEIVSLAGNMIEEIPKGISPNCPPIDFFTHECFRVFAEYCSTSYLGPYDCPRDKSLAGLTQV